MANVFIVPSHSGHDYSKKVTEQGPTPFLLGLGLIATAFGWWREGIARLSTLIERIDRHLGELLRELKDDGLYDVPRPSSSATIIATCRG
jgi:hypothetical protein